MVIITDRTLMMIQSVAQLVAAAEDLPGTLIELTLAVAAVAVVVAPTTTTMPTQMAAQL
jgi:hypothetical protein